MAASSGRGFLRRDEGTAEDGTRFRVVAGSAGVALIVLLALQGCKAGSAKREIVAIPLFSTENVEASEHIGMNEALAGTPIRLEFNGPPDGSAQRQIDLVRGAIGNDAYGITITPPSLYATNGVIREAVSRDIPVVVLMHAISPGSSAHLSFVVEDTRAAADLAAKQLKRVLPEGGDVMIAGLDSLAAGGQDRFRAMEEALGRIDPGVRIVARIVRQPSSDAFFPAIGEALEQHPSARGIVALDHHAAYVAAGLMHLRSPQKRIHIIAFDQDTEVSSALRAGEVDAMIVPDARTMGRIAVENIMRDRRHLSVPALTTVEPVLVTLDNIDSEPVQRVLAVNWVGP